MVRIRLSRKGKKKMPTYRIVVADVKFKRDGRYIENIGHYNPHTNPSTVVINEERALYWLSVGAQPSDAVKRFLESRGTYDRLKRVHAGESIEALIAEYEGTTPAEAVEEVVEAVVEKTEEVVEAVAETVEDAVEATAEVVSDVVETVQDTASDVVEAVSEKVEDVVEAVTEEEPADQSEAA